jgi:hypothetical protein
VNTLCPCVWNNDPGHTCDEYLVLFAKSSMTVSEQRGDDGELREVSLGSSQGRRQQSAWRHLRRLDGWDSAVEAQTRGRGRPVDDERLLTAEEETRVVPLKGTWGSSAQ